MRITLLHHAPSDFVWPELCDASGFNAAWQDSLSADLAPYDGEVFEAHKRLIYVGAQPAANQATAEVVLAGGQIHVSDLFNEIPLRSPSDGAAKRASQSWLRKAKQQWRFGNARQPETRKLSMRRADAAIDLIEQNHRDCIVVSGGRFLAVMISRLQARGYNVQRSRSFAIEPLERIRITKLDEYCGGCQNMCKLAHPGCAIGEERAREAL